MCPYLFISLLSGLCITLSWMQPKLWPIISLIRLWVPGRQCGTYLLLVVPAVSGQCSEGEGHSTHLAIGVVELDDVKETHDSLTMSKVEWTMDPTASGLVTSTWPPPSCPSMIQDVTIILLFEIHKTHWAFVFRIWFLSHLQSGKGGKLSPRAVHVSLIWYFQKSMPHINLQKEIEKCIFFSSRDDLQEYRRIFN